MGGMGAGGGKGMPGVGAVPLPFDLPLVGDSAPVPLHVQQGLMPFIQMGQGNNPLAPAQMQEVFMLPFQGSPGSIGAK